MEMSGGILLCFRVVTSTHYLFAEAILRRLVLEQGTDNGAAVVQDPAIE